MILDLLNVCELAEKSAIRAGADDAEAYASLDKEVEVFIERNDVKMGKAHSKSVLGIRVFKNKAAGFAAINWLSPESIREAAVNAVKMAKAAPSDKFNKLPEKSKPKSLQGIYDKNVRGFTAEDALERALLMLRIAKDYDKRITVDSGTFNTAILFDAIRNSNGIEASEQISTFSWTIVGMAVDGSDISNFDYQTGGTHSVRGIDVNVHRRNLRKTLLARSVLSV